MVQSPGRDDPGLASALEERFRIVLHFGIRTDNTPLPCYGVHRVDSHVETLHGEQVMLSVGMLSPYAG
jgi:hypothetical protein